MNAVATLALVAISCVALASAAQIKCNKGTKLKDWSAVTEQTCDAGIQNCKRKTYFGQWPTFSCADASETTAGDCTTEGIGPAKIETCICAGEKCNKQTGMAGESMKAGANAARGVGSVLVSIVAAVMLLAR